MSLNERKRQAKALIRLNWCNVNQFHEWIKKTDWICTPCARRQNPCTFSNKAATHCDHCIATRCSAKRDFRKAFFMQKFDITEAIYESWTYEWRMKIKPGAMPAGACLNVQAPSSSPHYFPDSPSRSPSISPGPGQPPGPHLQTQLLPAKYATPVPVLGDQGATAISVNQPRLPIASTEGQAVLMTPPTLKQSTDTDREVRLTNVKPDQVRNGNAALKTNNDRSPPVNTDTTPSIMQCLDQQIKFLDYFHTVSGNHMKILTVQKYEQERAHAKEDDMEERIRVLEQKLKESRESQEGTQAKEDKMKERICVLNQRCQKLQERAQAKDYEMTARIHVLEQQLNASQESQERLQATEHKMKEQIWVLQQQKLKESQESQERARVKADEVKERITALEQELKESQDSEELLRSRLKAIVQDLQIEVLRDEDGNTKKRKREETEEGELVYPSQRARSFN